MYKIYGDYGFVTETLLAEFELLSEAIRWAEAYTKDDLGGYDRIEVARHAADGEYVTERSWHAEILD